MVTLYVVVADGVAVVLNVFVLDRPTVGDHCTEDTLVAVLVAVSTVELPAQSATFAPAFTGGLGLGITFTVYALALCPGTGQALSVAMTEKK